MRLQSLSLLLAVAASCLFDGHVSAASAAQPSSAGAGPALDTFIVEKMDEAGIMGLGAALIVDRKVVWMKGFGFADRQRGLRFTPDTVMNIASISKTVTGVALMRAVEEGKLSLDEDINAYLPFKVVNPNHPTAKITLRHLATHTSGIAYHWAAYKDTYHYGGDAPESLGDFLKSYFEPGGRRYAKDNFLDARPGTHLEYSNIAAGLAGYIVELAVGERLDAYTKRQIFSPLGMDNTGWFLSEFAPGKHSTLYVSQNDMTIPIPPYGGTTYPDGGVRTSVADLSKLFIALLGDGRYEGKRVLSKESVDEMLRFQFSESNKPANLDLAEDNSGLFWATKFNVKRIGHGGSDPGLKTEMLANLSKDVGVILFSNTSLGGEAMRHYLAIFLELWKHAEALKAGSRKPWPGCKSTAGAGAILRASQQLPASGFLEGVGEEHR